MNTRWPQDRCIRRFIPQANISLIVKITPWFLSIMLAVLSIGQIAGAQSLDDQHYLAAHTAVIKGHIEKAKRELRLSLQNNPLNADSHILLACLLGQEGQLDQAIVGFQRALTLRPDDPLVLYNLGTSLMRRGRPVPAARMLEQAVSLRPEYIRGYNNLAMAYYQTGLPDLAVATYNEALRLDPGNPIAVKNLAIITDPAIRSDDATRQNGRANSPPINDLAQAPANAPDPDVSLPLLSSAQEAGGGEPWPAELSAAENDGDPALKDLQEILRDLTYVKIERRGGRIALTGCTSDAAQREMLTRILQDWPDVIDLTTVDQGDSKRMIEVDTTIFMVLKLDSQSVGFNFLRMIQMNFDYFTTNHRRDGIGFVAPNTIGIVSEVPQDGWLFSASVDYDVNIANAVDEEVALLARPHLTTLSGTPATFLAGGELVFKVSGLNSGDIKPYPFGTSITVTPTLLQTLGEDGNPRIHIVAEAGRTSVLSILSANSDEGPSSFSKVTVNSEAVLGLGQTLIMSGLSQRETTKINSGVPILRSIPILKWFFASETFVDSQLAVVILLTPRDPAYIDEQNRKVTQEFVEKRRAFIKALQGTDEDMKRYREQYPDWDRIPPNRYASHLFLSQYSDIYQNFVGQELTSEDLQFNLLSPKLEKLRTQ